MAEFESGWGLMSICRTFRFEYESGDTPALSPLESVGDTRLVSLLCSGLIKFCCDPVGMIWAAALRSSDEVISKESVKEIMSITESSPGRAM